MIFPEGQGPTEYQLEILEKLPAVKRIAVRGPHGIGKTALAAWIILWATLTEDNCKVPTTASAWRQVTKFLWPEVHYWAFRLNWALIGRQPFNNRTELTTLSLRRLPTCEAFGVVSDQPELIEGAHAKRVVYIYDEAKAIPDATFDASEGAFSSAGDDTDFEAFALAISTPGEPEGRFYDIHRHAPGYEDWETRHVSLEEAIAAGRVSRQWADQRKAQWGENSAIYVNRVLGEFSTAGTEGLIPLKWIEDANRRWEEWNESGQPWDRLTTIGVDVARTGEDTTVFALRSKNVIVSIRKTRLESTMQTAGRVIGIQRAYGGRAIVDVIGLGAGVVDRLRELKARVVAFNSSRKSMKVDKSGELGFINLRAEAWWNLRQMLEDEPIALPPDDELTGDLTVPKWKVTSTGKIQIESKQEIKRRLKRSTNVGDAVVQAFWRGTGGGVWRG